MQGPSGPADRRVRSPYRLLIPLKRRGPPRRWVPAGYRLCPGYRPGHAGVLHRQWATKSQPMRCPDAPGSHVGAIWTSLMGSVPPLPLSTQPIELLQVGVGQSEGRVSFGAPGSTGRLWGSLPERRCRRSMPRQDSTPPAPPRRRGPPRWYCQSPQRWPGPGSGRTPVTRPALMPLNVT